MAAPPHHQPPSWDPRVRRTAPPNPSWTWGDTVDRTERGRKWLEGIEGGWETFDAGLLDYPKLISIFMSSVTPRPIALVSTTSQDGVDNIAPYSFFTVAAADPPVLSITVEVHKNGGPKDTSRNIHATGEFVINTVNENFAEQMHATAFVSPPEQEEWGFSGLTKMPSDVVRPPRARESGVSFECKLLQCVPVVDPKTQKLATEVILGTVQRIHIRRDLITASPLNKLPQVDVEVARPLGRLGDLSYSSMGDMIRLPWKPWENVKDAAIEGAKRREGTSDIDTMNGNAQESKVE